MDKRLSAAGVAAAAAVAVAFLSGGELGRTLDRRIFLAVNRDRGPFLDALFKGITELGSIWASAGASVALTSRGRRREAMDALGAALGMWGLGQVAKRAVRRPRPYRSLSSLRLLIAEPNGTTFPSSHPAVLLTFVIVASRDLSVPASVRAGLGALVAAVGLSRVVLGVHYPADVAAGILFGVAVGEAWASSISPRVAGLPARRWPVQ